VGSCPSACYSSPRLPFSLPLGSQPCLDFVAASQRDVHPSSDDCLVHGPEPGWTVPVHFMFVTVTVGLCLSKVIAVCECPRFSILPRTLLTVLLDALYVMYNNRRTLLSRSQYSSSPTQAKSSTNSLFPSTPVRRSPFSPFKPKSKAFAKSLRHARPWSPTDIPTVKIDLASDQSSAPSYSNGSSSTSSAGFTVFGFATKYPSLRTVPLDPIGENLKAAPERERQGEGKGEGKRGGGFRASKRRDESGRDEVVEIPKLPEYSGLGSDYRHWARTPVVLVTRIDVDGTLQCSLSIVDSHSHIFIDSFHTLYFII